MATATDTDEITQAVISEHLSDRRIILNEDIDNDLLEKVCLMILNWNKCDINIPIKKRKKIYIYVNSNGGNVVFGLQLISSIKTSKTPIVTVGFANCSSMASYILASGHERYCFENTVVLYHDGQSGYYTSSNKGKDIQKFYDKLEEKTKEIMISKTKMTEEFLEDIKDREYYIFADEAKELGIVDKIIGVDCDIDEILS